MGFLFTLTNFYPLMFGTTVQLWSLHLSSGNILRYLCKKNSAKNVILVEGGRDILNPVLYYLKNFQIKYKEIGHFDIME